MSIPALENGLETLAFARKATLGLLEDIPDDKLRFRPGGAGNHATWITGHLAWTDDHFLSKLGDRESKCTGEWDALFGKGSRVLDQAEKYPPFTELREALSERRETLVSWFLSMSGERLAAALPEDWQVFAKSYGVLINTIAWHEGMHAGQLTVIRRELGLGPKFG